MSTFEDIKKVWANNQPPVPGAQPYNQAALERLAKDRVKKHMAASMHYFWASFTLQIIVYALLSHVIIKYGADPQTLWVGLAGMALYLPFTIILMRKFKRMAVLKPVGTTIEGPAPTSLFQYIRTKHDLLQSFYTFKKRYELLLIPLSTAIGVYLTFRLFVPGGVEAHPTGAIITAAITLLCCGLAIFSENKKSFQQPLQQLRELLKEFKTAD
ncbi:MAG TPA: hypothetical protein VD794_02865 [Flavisolibacter sp.]|nr:hypothetical protein [Flavisolibacter sp.]